MATTVSTKSKIYDALVKLGRTDILPPSSVPVEVVFGVDSISVTGRSISSNSPHRPHRGFLKLKLPNPNGERKRCPVEQRDMDGNLIKTYESARSVEQFGFSYSNVRSVCTGKTVSHRGFRWNYVGETRPEILQRRGKKRNEYNIRPVAEWNIKRCPVEQRDMDGNLIKTYPSQQATAVDGFCIAAVAQCCDGKGISHKGYRWNKVGETRPEILNRQNCKRKAMEVLQFTMEGVLIKQYKSAVDAANQTGFLIGGIKKACRGLHKHSAGYQWQYSTSNNQNEQ